MVEELKQLRFLVVARHGDYGGDDNLSQRGAEQMRNLAEKMLSIVDGSKIILLSSTARRASQSAEVISQVLKVPFEEHEVLWSENCHPENEAELLELVRARKPENQAMILVTHLEYAEYFPTYFARHELGMKLEGGCWPPIPKKGQACLIDCFGKSFKLLG